MDDEDDEIQSHPSPSPRSESPPSPHPNGRITVTVAAAPPLNNTLTLALPLQQQPPPLQQQQLLLPPPQPHLLQQRIGGNGGGREDCWSEAATAVLIDAWGERYLELSRGNLKQKHWKEVADIVSSREHFGKTPKTDIQCKNRIDTVKKKYKKEKIRVLDSAGKYVSKWPFFDFLDFLIGSPSPEGETGKPTCRRGRKMSFPASLEIPVGRRSKRLAPESEVFSRDGDVGRRKFEAMAEVAAKIVAEEAEEGGDGEGEIEKVAEAIEKFGERYERVEREKMDRLIELEKHKMKLAIDLNVQIMNYVSELRMKVDRNEEAGVVDDEKGMNCFCVDMNAMILLHICYLSVCLSIYYTNMEITFGVIC